jgi:hypothetical protein
VTTLFRQLYPHFFMKRFLPYGLMLAQCISSLNAELTEVDFAREVLPVLSNKCFVCHGPDTKKKDLIRLDSEEGAKKDLGGYHAVDEKKPEDSELIFRIFDEDEPMPPKKFAKTLTKEEKELLKKWVLSGGKYAKHWAFVRPERNKVEENAVDHYVGAMLRAKGVDFASEAKRGTLARRVALTLTGLPPEPALLDAFLKDKRGDSYERYVDSLLADSSYGEHQARYWLDAVRYGDTHGLHLDNKRGIYPYRDWVVRAFNDNLPLDQFITWQLAGDMLPQPTLDQKIATGFVRMNPSTAEGGAIPAEFQAKNNFDRVESLGTSLLGLSLICARCHTHKYDPIAHTEYYQLIAFFNNTAESPMDGNRYEYGDHIKVPADQKAWREWKALEEMEAKFLTRVRESGKYPEGHESLGKLAALVDSNDLTRKGNRIRAISGKSPKNQTPAQAIDDDPKTKYLNFEGNGSGLIVHARKGVVDKIALTSGEDAPFRDPTSYALFGSEDGKTFKEIAKGIIPTFSKRRQRIELPIKNSSAFAIYKLTFPSLASPKADAMQISEVELLKAGVKEAHDFLLKAVELRKEKEKAMKSFTTTLVARELPKPRETKLLDRGEYDMPVGDPLQPGVPVSLGSLPEGAPPNRLGLASWLVSRDQPLVSRVLVNRIWQRVFGDGLVRTPDDFGLQGQQPTHPELLDWLAVELQDGGWDLKKIIRLLVTSKTFRQDSSYRKEFPDSANLFYARGPSYRLDAEVLRDLALWSSKLLDPTMGGEGVKPYQPPGMWKELMHPGSNTKNYIADKGSRLYRRSLYVYWKRTSPHPMMTLFDAPSREASCVRRSRTNTPLQSLALFNEPQRVEASRKLAERLLKEGKEDDDRLDLLFTLVASRKPSKTERVACEKLLQSQRARYARNGEEAEGLSSVGDAPRDPDLDIKEVAAWAQVAGTVLASDLAILLY